MPIDPKAPGWDARQAALVAEFSEAHAYAAMATATARLGMGSAPVIAPLADGLALRSHGDHSTTLFNRVFGLGLTRAFDARTAAAVAAHYAGSAEPWGLEIAPPALQDGARTLLKQMQLRRSLPTAMLAMDCADLRDPPPAWRVERVGPELGAVAAAIIAPVFGVSPSVARILAAAPNVASIGLWMVFEGPDAVAVCLTHVHGDTAWFGWSATKPSHRRRGLQSALLWHCVRDAAEQGCRWITAETTPGTVHAPDASYRNMLRFGFVELYRRHGHLHVPRRRVSVWSDSATAELGPA